MPRPISELAGFLAKKQKAMVAIVTMSLGGLNSKIISRTPVDTGRLRGNWQATLDAPSNQSLHTTDQEGAETAYAAYVVAQQAPGRKYYLANNLDYAYEIEMGKSGQAPTGMLEISIAEWDQICKRAVIANGGTS